MRELILKMSMSLDGFVSGPDGELAWMFSGDPEAKAWSIEIISDASLHIMGSDTFRAMAAHWPTATDGFAEPMNQIPKAVFSRRRSATPQTTADPSATSRPGHESWANPHVASGDLGDEIANLKAQPGKPIIAHGGARFARALAASGLVDRYALLVHPIALGEGQSLFSDLPVPRPLALIEARAFPMGAVAQIYRPA